MALGGTLDGLGIAEQYTNLFHGLLGVFFALWPPRGRISRRAAPGWRC